MTDIFNDYNDDGYRVTMNGNRSSRTEDNAIVRNLRGRWPEELKDFSDQKLVNTYDEFALSEDFGDNDAKFLEFIQETP